MSRSVKLIAGAILTLLLIAGFHNRLNAPIEWPTEDEDRSVLAQVNQEMSDEYGKAWREHHHLVCRTNPDLSERMFLDFRRRLDAHYSVKQENGVLGKKEESARRQSFRW